MNLPLVSVGMPVRNGGGYFSVALNSILAQDYPNLEIIVSDNYSDDNTGHVAAELAMRDARIRIVKPHAPLTALGNFEFVLRQATGEYFLWAAHDDLRSTDYISHLVKCLERNPAGVLAFGDLYVTSKFGTAGEVRPFDFATAGMPRGLRMRRAALQQCYHIYGIWRTSVLKSIRFVTNPWWPDLPIMISAAAIGEFCYAPGARFSYYEVPKTSAQRAQYQDHQSGFGLGARITRTILLPIAAFRSARSSAGCPAGLIAVYVVMLRIIRDGSIYFRRLVGV